MHPPISIHACFFPKQTRSDQISDALSANLWELKCACEFFLILPSLGWFSVCVTGCVSVCAWACARVPRSLALCERDTLCVREEREREREREHGFCINVSLFFSSPSVALSYKHVWTQTVLYPLLMINEWIISHGDHVIQYRFHL